MRYILGIKDKCSDIIKYFKRMVNLSVDILLRILLHLTKKTLPFPQILPQFGVILLKSHI